MSNWIKGKVEIFKIHDGEKTKVYEDNNIVTTGMGYALCNLFTEQEDQEIENFQIGYFQLGTNQIPVSTMQTPRVFYTLSAGFGTSDYGSNLDTEVKDLSILGSILPTNPNFGIDLEYQYTNIDASYNQLMALRPGRFLYSRDLRYNNNLTTSTFADTTNSIFGFSCYRDSDLETSRFAAGILSSITTNGVKLVFSELPVVVYSPSGIVANGRYMNLNSEPPSDYATILGLQNASQVALGKYTIYLIQEYATNQGTKKLLKELVYLNTPTSLSPTKNGYYDYLTVSTISGYYNVQNGFQGQEVEALVPAGKNCTLVKANRVSDNTKLWYLVGTSSLGSKCNNFQNVRNYLNTITDSSEFYPVEITTNQPTGETRLALIRKDGGGRLTAVNLPVDTNPNETVPAYAVLNIPSYLQPENLPTFGINAISLTQETPGASSTYGIALDTDNKLTAWGSNPNHPIIKNIPSGVQGNCAAVKLSGDKAHAITFDGSLYSWGVNVNYPFTNTIITNPVVVEPILDTSAYGFAELPESRKLQLQNNSNKYRLFLDKGMAAGKTIKEIGLFIKNPNVDYNIDKPILAAYKALNFNLTKTSEFELMIDWSISITDGA